MLLLILILKFMNIDLGNIFFFKRLTEQGKICYNMDVNKSGDNMRVAMR